jgi:pimeloyl-ACP methyl ester carboxylesterase
MLTQLCAVTLALAAIAQPTTARTQPEPPDTATVVLVHGAFAESASWNGVATRLRSVGYTVVAAANPLRGVRSDARYVADIVNGIDGPVVLVGHSYGGAVISDAGTMADNVKALVFVAAFAPAEGETSAGLSTLYPGSTLGEALAAPVMLDDGGRDLYIEQARYPAQFAADVPHNEAALMAIAQRPVTEAALNEAAGPPAWSTTPSWFVYGSADRNIPEAALSFMAERAGARRTLRVEGASHSIMVSEPEAVADIIIEAAESR